MKLPKLTKDNLKGQVKVLASMKGKELMEKIDSTNA